MIAAAEKGQQSQPDQILFARLEHVENQRQQDDSKAEALKVCVSFQRIADKIGDLAFGSEIYGAGCRRKIPPLCFDFYVVVSVVALIRCQLGNISAIHAFRGLIAVDHCGIRAWEIEEALSVIVKREKKNGSAVRGLCNLAAFQKKRSALRNGLQFGQGCQVDSRGTDIGPIENTGKQNCKNEYSEDAEKLPSTILHTVHLLSALWFKYILFAGRGQFRI